MEQNVVLDEHVLYEQGNFRYVRRWLRGRHPHLGPMMVGWSGDWETVVETGVVRPARTFGVEEGA